MTNITEVASFLDNVCDQAAAVEAGLGLVGESLHSRMSNTSVDEDAIVGVGAESRLQRSLKAVSERLTAIQERFTSLERDLCSLCAHIY